jgi:hypothetical protein
LVLVSDLVGLVESMRGARERWTTVRATLRKWYDVVLMQAALDRFVAQEPPGSVGRLVPEDDADDGAERATEPRFWVTELRVWGRKPYRWRIETDWWYGASEGEVGDRAWRSDLAHRGMEELDPPDLPPLDATVAWVFDPRIALGEFDVVRVLGRTTHAGREATRVVATAGEEMRSGQTGPLWASNFLGWGAEAFELLVDTERGALLRSAGLLGGEEFARIEVVEVGFDEDLPEDVFVGGPSRLA